jgi:hypothetical protein
LMVLVMILTTRRHLEVSARRHFEAGTATTILCLLSVERTWKLPVPSRAGIQTKGTDLHIIKYRLCSLSVLHFTFNYLAFPTWTNCVSRRSPSLPVDTPSLEDDRRSR